MLRMKRSFFSKNKDWEQSFWLCSHFFAFFLKKATQVRFYML